MNDSSTRQVRPNFFIIRIAVSSEFRLIFLVDMYPKKGYNIFYGIRCRHEEKVRKRGKETSTLGSEKTSCPGFGFKRKRTGTAKVAKL